MLSSWPQKRYAPRVKSEASFAFQRLQNDKAAAVLRLVTYRERGPSADQSSNSHAAGMVFTWELPQSDDEE